MFPIIFDLPSSNVNIEKPRIELSTGITTINIDSNRIFNNSKFKIIDFQDFVSTCIVMPQEKTTLTFDDITNYEQLENISFNLNYFKTITKKVKIKSISKSNPNMIL